MSARVNWRVHGLARMSDAGPWAKLLPCRQQRCACRMSRVSEVDEAEGMAQAATVREAIRDAVEKEQTTKTGERQEAPATATSERADP